MSRFHSFSCLLESKRWSYFSRRTMPSWILIASKLLDANNVIARSVILTWLLSASVFTLSKAVKDSLWPCGRVPSVPSLLQNSIKTNGTWVGHAEKIIVLGSRGYCVMVSLFRFEPVVALVFEKGSWLNPVLEHEKVGLGRCWINVAIIEKCKHCLLSVSLRDCSIHLFLF